MELARLYGAAEVLVPVVVFVVVALRRWTSGMHDAWRDEAEAYRLKSERQSEELAALRAELRELRRELAERDARSAALLGRETSSEKPQHD
ncbi:hypothetical protein [Streptomyces sp. NPDC001404]|uniref:hypothetical protein n=1 Tax=Streptomyces sp. NPDC001404 TaxID=3364571 RepID=UPI0036791F3C